MTPTKKAATAIAPVLLLVLTGCTVQRVNFADFARPSRAAELEAFETFVGKWTWDAVMLNATDTDKAWTGTAEWKWILDKRGLAGQISGKSANTEFDAQGIWSWHPRSHKYVWRMFNNWGYPQEGNATYDATTQTWNMKYVGIGLDGTRSYGRHRMTVVDSKTLEWDVIEWADPAHLVVKMEMRGTYKRYP